MFFNREATATTYMQRAETLCSWRHTISGSSLTKSPYPLNGNRRRHKPPRVQRCCHQFTTPHNDQKLRKSTGYEATTEFFSCVEKNMNLRTEDYIIRIRNPRTIIRDLCILYILIKRSWRTTTEIVHIYVLPFS